jgi:hypothetical protein
MLALYREYDSVKKLAGALSEIFKDKKLVDYKLIRIHDKAPVVSEIEVQLIFERLEDGIQVTDNRTFRFMYLDKIILAVGFSKLLIWFFS